MGQLLEVGISDLKIANKPDSLITYALGSCVGICLYDSVAGIAGMSHVLLPDSAANRGVLNPHKYADTAITELVLKMEGRGCSRMRMKAKIAGGANMFANSTINVGERNVEAVKRRLFSLRIPIIAEDTGKNYGRTIEFSSETGSLLIKAIGKGVCTI